MILHFGVFLSTIVLQSYYESRIIILNNSERGRRCCVSI